MIDAYLRYYQSPTLKLAKQLWTKIAEYDYSEPFTELLEYRCKLAPQLHLSDYSLASNGTSGYIRYFTFGPHTEFWLTQIEDFIKCRRQNKFVSIMAIPYMGGVCDHQRIPPSQIREDAVHHIISAPLHKPNGLDFLITRLSALEEYAISTNPNNWLYLLSSQRFREYLCQHTPTMATSTNWEGFYKTPPPNIHFNNNMVNWTTTMNFYTCEHGTKHFLPTFIPTTNGIVNLLNLSRPALWPIDDHMHIEAAIRQCACGRKYQQFQFVPHIAHSVTKNGQTVFDLELANRLHATYLNLQFIQHGNTIDILYIGTNQPDDTLHHYFSKLGFSTSYISDKYYRMGAKLPVFWNAFTTPQYKDWRDNLVVDK